jgi:pyruvate,water dikinase
MKQYLLNLPNALALNPKFSGSKGANLVRLIKQGFNVPPFFILSSSLYEHIVKINKIEQLIKKVVSENSLENFKQAQSAILAAKIPNPIIREIISTWKILIQDFPFQKVAVRSSALAEDLQEHSFAGQLESYLNIQDEQHLLESIKKCWASLWNERVQNYTSNNRIKINPQAIAVIVQQMIPAEFSGVFFTIDPTDAEQESSMIETHEGMGTEIVGGHINPARYRIHRKSQEMKSDADQSNSSSFSREHIFEFVSTCLEIEKYFRAPQDIEWAYFQNRFYILQSRPITATVKRQLSSEENIWSNYFFGERFPQPVSPLGWSILKPLIEKNAFCEPLYFLGFHRLARSRITKCFYGRPYAKLAVFQALHSFFPTAYVSLDKRKFFYEEPVSLRQSIIKIVKNIFPILKSLFSTTDWIPPIHLRNWRRFLNFYQEKIQSLNQLNLQVMSDEQLWQMNDQTEQRSDRLLSYHRWSITFAELIFHFIRHLIQKWLPQLEAEKTVIELHRGLTGNKTVEMNIELWNLSRAKKQNWKSFIQKFGHRSTSLDISIATFAEDRNYILELVQQYQTISPELSPKKRQKDFVQLRQERCESILQILSQQHFGFLKKKFLKILMNWSEQFMLLRENQRHYWHQSLAINRKIFLEFGKRFVHRGWLEHPERIFFLTRQEIKSIIFSDMLVPKTKIEQRLQLHSRWQKIQAPALIDQANPLQLDDDFVSKKLTGIAASPGLAGGKARVLTSLDEMKQIQSGEILVVPTTDPGWTPLFSIINGLVMEVGGVLSHGSIIAREFGIPAVTSVQQATSLISSGMSITVDGNKGVVWIDDH